MLHKHESHLFHMCSTAHLNASRIRLNTPCIHATHHGMHVGHVEHLFFGISKSRINRTASLGVNTLSMTFRSLRRLRRPLPILVLRRSHSVRPLLDAVNKLTKSLINSSDCNPV